MKIKSMSEIKILKDQKVRNHYDINDEIWYFSMVDIVEALTDSTNATDYLKKEILSLENT